MNVPIFLCKLRVIHQKKNKASFILKDQSNNKKDSIYVLLAFVSIFFSLTFLFMLYFPSFTFSFHPYSSPSLFLIPLHSKWACDDKPMNLINHHIHTLLVCAGSCTVHRLLTLILDRAHRSSDNRHKYHVNKLNTFYGYYISYLNFLSLRRHTDK